MRIGDTITTSYGSSPFVVARMTPLHYVDYFPGIYVVRTWPVFSIISTRDHIINDIRLLPDGRYFTDANDEVSVIAGATGTVIAQASLFDVEPETIAGPSPAEFLVDGKVFDWAWSCSRCYRYLGPCVDPRLAPQCPDHLNVPPWSKRVVELLPRPEPPARPEAVQRNSMLLSMNVKGLHVHPAHVVSRTAEVPV